MMILYTAPCGRRGTVTVNSFSRTYSRNNSPDQMEIMANLQAAYGETAPFALNPMTSWGRRGHSVSGSCFWPCFWTEGRSSVFEREQSLVWGPVWTLPVPESPKRSTSVWPPHVCMKGVCVLWLTSYSRVNSCTHPVSTDRLQHPSSPAYK